MKYPCKYAREIWPAESKNFVMRPILKKSLPTPDVNYEKSKLKQ